MRAIYGLYPDPGSAQCGADALRHAASELGLPEGALAVLSSVPCENYEFGYREARTFMPWLAALGGLMGGLSGFVLAAFTQRSFPIPTGGMAIVPLWTDGIIIYELTMLGAIVATLATLLATARIPDWSSHLYDPRVADGKILVGIVDPPERSVPDLRRALQDAGAEQVKEFSVA